VEGGGQIILRSDVCRNGGLGRRGLRFLTRHLLRVQMLVTHKREDGTYEQGQQSPRGTELKAYARFTFGKSLDETVHLIEIRRFHDVDVGKGNSLLCKSLGKHGNKGQGE